MDKPVLFYEVRVHQNRITGGPVYVPAIVEREEAVPLDEIIRRAIDRGLIAGIKPTAAHGIAAGTCGEIADLDRYGIEHSRCVDDRLMVKCFSRDVELMKFIGAKFVPGDPLFGVEDRWEPGPHKKDPGQRLACGCIMSKDIGEYNTCPHHCHYCYANTNNAAAMENWKRHCACPHAETITGNI